MIVSKHYLESLRAGADLLREDYMGNVLVVGKQLNGDDVLHGTIPQKVWFMSSYFERWIMISIIQMNAENSSTTIRDSREERYG